MIRISIIGQSGFGKSVTKEIKKMEGADIASIFTPDNKKDELYKFAMETKR